MSDEKTQEQVYEEQIRPLMSQIKGVCQEHGIPWVASFQVAGERGKMDILTCIDGQLTDEGSSTRALYRAALALNSDEIESRALVELLNMNAVLRGLLQAEPETEIEA